MQLSWQFVTLHLRAHVCKGSLKLTAQPRYTKGAKSSFKFAEQTLFASSVTLWLDPRILSHLITLGVCHYMVYKIKQNEKSE